MKLTHALDTFTLLKGYVFYKYEKALTYRLQKKKNKQTNLKRFLD